mmetsp:Transcript_23287/g.43233  ORF Transcript_23287/g.43233 Transcript_23287/m.43233 type:complete len:534 (-) Transcript_23287:471-2072(-)
MIMISESLSNEELAKVLCNLQALGHHRAAAAAAAAANGTNNSGGGSPPVSASAPPTTSSPPAVGTSSTSAALPAGATTGAARVPTPSPPTPVSVALAAPTSPSSSSASSLTSFPFKLYEMMQDAGKCGFEDVVSWQPTNSSFKVYDTNRFVKEIMPKYFKQTRYKSFQRQLNIYGFQRIHDGPHRGGYHHPYFLKDNPQLLKLIPRKRGASDDGTEPPSTTINGVNTGSPLLAAAAAAASVPKQPPQDAASSWLQSMFPTTEQQQLAALLGASSSTSSSPLQGSNAAATLASLPAEQLQSLMWLARGSGGGATTQPAAALNNNNSGGNIASLLSSILGGNNSNTSAAAALAAAAAPSLANPASPTSTATVGQNQHVFPWKLFKMLQEAPAKNFSHIVSWVHNGEAFKVHNTKDFVQQVMPQYFDQTKYESFRRQLNLYGFTRIVRGQHRGVYSHPMFHRAHQDWCRYITRQQFSQLSNGKNNSNHNHHNNNKGEIGGTEHEHQEQGDKHSNSDISNGHHAHSQEESASATAAV